ncbi:MAG: hypothetical protein AABW73_02485 [Nanoarchaeota archaeon]
MVNKEHHVHIAKHEQLVFVGIEGKLDESLEKTQEALKSKGMESEIYQDPQRGRGIEAVSFNPIMSVGILQAGRRNNHALVIKAINRPGLSTETLQLARDIRITPSSGYSRNFYAKLEQFSDQLALEYELISFIAIKAGVPLEKAFGTITYGGLLERCRGYTSHEAFAESLRKFGIKN